MSKLWYFIKYYIKILFTDSQICNTSWGEWMIQYEWQNAIDTVIAFAITVDPHAVILFAPNHIQY